jgi:hypothetical protein
MNRSFAFALALIVAAGVSIGVYGQIAKRRAGLSAKDKATLQAIARARANLVPKLEAPKFRVFLVTPAERVAPEDADLHQQVADRLSKLTNIPPHRPVHFQWLNRPDFEIKQWRGIIQSVQPGEDGRVVTVRVSPDVWSTHGSSTTILDHVIETYRIAYDGKCTLIGVQEPRESFAGSYITD